MEIKDIMDLVHAGFSKEEIIKLTSSTSIVPPLQQSEQPAPEPGIPEQAQQEPIKEEPEQTQVPPMPVDNVYQARMDSLERTMKELSDTIKANAIRTGGGESPRTESIEDIFASIINP